MSRFLGPIHYIVFNRIKAFEELENTIVQQVDQSCDTDISTLITQLYQEYGQPLDDTPLEDMIDTDNIHGWLQNRIDIAGKRHAAIISNILRVCGEKAYHMMKNAYEEQGEKYGEDANQTKDVSTAPSLYQGIKFYLLDGMPCDQVDEVLEKQEDSFKWQVRECLHRKYWNTTDSDINQFYELRAAWIKGFVTKANPEFTYQFEQKNIDGQMVLFHGIVK